MACHCRACKQRTGAAYGLGIYFYEEDNSNLGDVTQDGTINIVDVILMINFILELQTLSDDQLELADVNMDTIINIIDILIVMDIILNN